MVEQRPPNGNQSWNRSTIPLWVAISVVAAFTGSQSIQLIQSDKTPDDVYEQVTRLREDIKSQTNDRYYGWQGRALEARVKIIDEQLNDLEDEVEELKDKLRDKD